MIKARWIKPVGLSYWGSAVLLKPERSRSLAVQKGNHEVHEGSPVSPLSSSLSPSEALPPPGKVEAVVIDQVRFCRATVQGLVAGDGGNRATPG